MSEKVFIETVLEIVDNAVDKIERMEPGETFAPETYLIAAGGAWAVPVSWHEIKSEEKTEVEAVFRSGSSCLSIEVDEHSILLQ